MSANKLVNRLNKAFPFSPGYEAFRLSNQRVVFIDPMRDYCPRYFDVLQEGSGFAVEWDSGEKRKAFKGFDQLCEYIAKRIAYN